MPFNVDQLDSLVSRIEQLSRDADWQGLVELDGELRKVVELAVESESSTHQDMSDSRVMPLIQKLQQTYLKAISELDTAKDDSAEELQKIRKSANAAQQYIKSSKL